MGAYTALTRLVVLRLISDAQRQPRRCDVPEEPISDRWLDVSVDRGRCCGYAVCVGLCPEVFDLDEDGLARIVIDAVPIKLEAAVRHAAASCPEAAIIVKDDPSAPSNGKNPS